MQNLNEMLRNKYWIKHLKKKNPLNKISKNKKGKLSN